MDPQRLQKQSQGEGGGSIMWKKKLITIKTSLLHCWNIYLTESPNLTEMPMTPPRKVHRYAPPKAMGFELGGDSQEANFKKVIF